MNYSIVGSLVAMQLAGIPPPPGSTWEGVSHLVLALATLLGVIHTVLLQRKTNRQTSATLAKSTENGVKADVIHKLVNSDTDKVKAELALAQTENRRLQAVIVGLNHQLRAYLPPDQLRPTGGGSHD